MFFYDFCTLPAIKGLYKVAKIVAIANAQFMSFPLFSGKARTIEMKIKYKRSRNFGGDHRSAEVTITN